VIIIMLTTRNRLIASGLFVISIFIRPKQFGSQHVEEYLSYLVTVGKVPASIQS